MILVVGALLGVGGWLQHLREEYYPTPPVGESSLYITSGHALRYLSLGYQALAADLYLDPHDPGTTATPSSRSTNGRIRPPTRSATTPSSIRSSI